MIRMFRRYEKKEDRTDNSFYRARVKAGMSQEEASVISGVDRTTIQGWENGRNPERIKAARALAEAYGCTLGELIGMDVLEGPKHE